MPDITDRFGLQVPLGTENMRVTPLSINYLTIDTCMGSLSTADPEALSQKPDGRICRNTNAAFVPPEHFIRRSGAWNSVGCWEKSCQARRLYEEDAPEKVFDSVNVVWLFKGSAQGLRTDRRYTCDWQTIFKFVSGGNIANYIRIYMQAGPDVTVGGGTLIETTYTVTPTTFCDVPMSGTFPFTVPSAGQWTFGINVYTNSGQHSAINNFLGIRDAGT